MTKAMDKAVCRQSVTASYLAGFLGVFFGVNGSGGVASSAFSSASVRFAPSRLGSKSSLANSACRSASDGCFELFMVGAYWGTGIFGKKASSASASSENAIADAFMSLTKYGACSFPNSFELWTVG